MKMQICMRVSICMCICLSGTKQANEECNNKGSKGSCNDDNGPQGCYWILKGCQAAFVESCHLSREILQHSGSAGSRT